MKNPFKKKQLRPIPPWEEIVEYMQDKQLSCFSDEIVMVIYSKNKEKRIIILKSPRGFFKVIAETIFVYDKDEWMYFQNDPGAYPAWWGDDLSFVNLNTKSFFQTADDALREIKTDPQYKFHFE